MEAKKKFVMLLAAIPIAIILQITDMFFDGWIINQIYNSWMLSITGVTLSYVQCIGIGLFLSILVFLMRPDKTKKEDLEADDDYLERVVTVHLSKYISITFCLFVLQFIWGFIS